MSVSGNSTGHSVHAHTRRRTRLSVLLTVSTLVHTYTLPLIPRPLTTWAPCPAASHFGTLSPRQHPRSLAPPSQRGHSRVRSRSSRSPSATLGTRSTMPSAIRPHST